ncbi:MAG: Asp-tRNA(Asn)/Glu-tRNA(Gln) amidotransferase subunit GatB [Pirellulales bacterium]|nr:Asp-tRNA(Asn)/Glu-tRNA(Gln) amidotransferase subunit GatB [Pirellulales bacterium]
MNDSLPYTTIIGLEVHVQLATRSKLFCRCENRYGADPNTLTCPVCAGLPGALPVMNRSAYELSVRAAVGLNCEIPLFTKWDRKNYFYADLPKGFQTSQFDLPLSQHGYLDISDPKGEFSDKRIGIIRAHLEEDAGKSLHDEAAGKADSRIDLNRCGTPLLEIVSEPDLRSPEEVGIYLSDLKLLLEYLRISDCNMQEGSLRVDANINLHLPVDGELKATPIVEVKNMNSFRAVQRALAYEAVRQYEQWQESGRCLGDPGVTKETRGWDDDAGVSRSQRSKEESSDYRYFPEPDLPPVVITEAEVEAHRLALGELPAALRTRLVAEYQLPEGDADVLVNQGRPLVDYFFSLAGAIDDGKIASNWIQQDVMRYLSEVGVTIDDYPVAAEQLGSLIADVLAKKLSTSRGREVLAQMVSSGETPQAAMQSLGIVEVDSAATEQLCRELLEANPKVVADIKEGKMKAVGALVGQAKQRNPNVQPQEVRDLCLRLAGEM